MYICTVHVPSTVCNVLCVTQQSFFISTITDITIQFEQTDYSVNEGGTVDVCILMMNPNGTTTNEFGVVLSLSDVDTGEVFVVV